MKFLLSILVSAAAIALNVSVPETPGSADRSTSGYSWTMKGPGGPNDVGPSSSTVFEAAIEYQGPPPDTTAEIIEVRVEIPANTAPTAAAELVEEAFEAAGVAEGDAKSTLGTVRVKVGISGASVADIDDGNGMKIDGGSMRAKVSILEKKRKVWQKTKGTHGPIDPNEVPKLSLDIVGYDSNGDRAADRVQIVLTNGLSEAASAQQIVNTLNSLGWSCVANTDGSWQINSGPSVSDVYSVNARVNGEHDHHVMVEV